MPYLRAGSKAAHQDTARCCAEYRLQAMTTHRNLKPHYAERKGKSGPVIVVKKGEVMSEPTTFRDVLAEAVHSTFGRNLNKYDRADDIIAALPDEWNPDKLAPMIEANARQEARANADLELRPILDEIDTYGQEMRMDWSECDGREIRRTLNEFTARIREVLAASEQ